MKLVALLVCAAALVGLGASCRSSEPASDDGPTAEDRRASTFANTGYYCSATTPSGGWYFGWGDLDFNVCQYASGMQPKQYGMYTTSGQNTVQANCNGTTGIWGQWGNTTLGIAYQWAVDNNLQGCVFTVTPGWGTPPSPPAPSPGCASNSVAQHFGTLPSGVQQIVGCQGSVAWSDRATLCGTGWSVATASDWAALAPYATPTGDYWTNDYLGYAGATGNCSVEPINAGWSQASNPIKYSACSSGAPMHVCGAYSTSCTSLSGCSLYPWQPNADFGGCSTTAGTLCKQDVRPVSTTSGCASGSAAQDFGVFTDGSGDVHHVVGCTASKSPTWDQRASVCANGWEPAPASSWQAVRGSQQPTNVYWTNDALTWTGSGPGNCAVSTTQGGGFSACGNGGQMAVCPSTGSDAHGNSCTWPNCGYGQSSPDAYFGGCTWSAGTLCEQVLPVATAPKTLNVSAFVSTLAADLDTYTGWTSTNNLAGYQVAMADPSGTVTARHGGFSGYSSQAMTDATRIDVASVSKTITAIAVLAVMDDLRARGAGITIDSSISPYLPKVWTQSPRMKDVTFRHLLSHTSGLPQNWGSQTCGNITASACSEAGENTFCQLAANVAQGPCDPGPGPCGTVTGASCQVSSDCTGLAPLAWCNGNTGICEYDYGWPAGTYGYSNPAIALERVVLPYLVDGPAFYAPYEQSNDWASLQDLTAQSYRNIVRQRVLDPLGLSAIDVVWTGASGTSETRYVSPSYPGSPRLDSTMCGSNPGGKRLGHEETAGPGWWTMSATELVEVLAAVRNGTVMSPFAFAEMTADQYAILPVFNGTTNQVVGFNPNDVGLGLFGSPTPSSAWASLVSGGTAGIGTRGTVQWPSARDISENGGGGDCTGPGAQWMMFPSGHVAAFLANTQFTCSMSCPQIQSYCYGGGDGHVLMETVFQSSLQ